MAKNYQLAHRLGTRNKQNSILYAAVLASNNEHQYMIKVTDLDKLRDSGQIRQVYNELSRTKNINHVNILPLLNCFLSDTQLWCIYPFVFYGSCRDILDSINAYHLQPTTPTASTNQLDEHQVGAATAADGPIIDRADEQKRLCFNEHSLQPITKSILNALDYLHSKHLVHRCICPENIYISHTGHIYLAGAEHSVSLLDHGVLHKRLHDYPSHLDDYVDYFSPEMLQQNLIGYNQKTDIYSLGVTLCELANGTNPFVGLEKAQMMYEKLAGFDIGLWDRSILTSESKDILSSVYSVESPRVIASVQRRLFSDKFRNFVDLCVQRNQEARPSVQQLLQHVYLKKAKLQNCVSILQCSILSEGIVDLQRKCEEQSIGHKHHHHHVITVKENTQSGNNEVDWSF